MSLASREKRASRDRERYERKLIARDIALICNTEVARPTRKADKNAAVRTAQALAGEFGCSMAKTTSEQLNAMEDFRQKILGDLGAVMRPREMRLAVESGSGCGSTDSVLLDDAFLSAERANYPLYSRTENSERGDLAVKILGNILIALKVRGVTQRELASILHIERSILSHRISGNPIGGEFTHWERSRCAAFLNAPKSWLFMPTWIPQAENGARGTPAETQFQGRELATNELPRESR